MSRPSAPANRILVWMCVLIAINQLGFGSIVPVMALSARSFGVLQSAIGVAIGVYGLARFLVAVRAWQLADRRGRHTTLAVGGLVSAAGNLLCAYAPTFMAFVGARFVAGAGAALVFTGGQIVLADITTPARRGRTSYGWFLIACVVWSVASGVSGAAPATYAADLAPGGMNAAAMSAFRMLGDLGYVVGPVALGLATDLFGANAALASAAALLMAVALLFARYAPETYGRGRF